jgi:adenine-specific DNA-methyltransferase
MTDQPEKLDLNSPDLSAEKRKELLDIFPEARTEDGKIDFDRLKLALGETVDLGKERYGMNWPGKADCFRAVQTPSTGTLLPYPAESVNFDTTENLIIEGDNLEVLKLLQKSYLGKVKMIYIDPPYNTGNDFIYPDNYSESLQTYLEYTGQVDAEGKKFGTNSDTDGRFHSRWLNMMYPRLYLARNLLREDGVIFISIDDSEVSNLQKLCDEIFGEENFVAILTWKKRVSPANDAKWFSSDHEYILVYGLNKLNWFPIRLERNSEQNAYYKNPDNDPRGAWNSAAYTCNKSKTQRPNLFYPITNPNTSEEILPRETAVWAYSKEKHLENANNNLIYWGIDGKSRSPRIKQYIFEAKNVVPRSFLDNKNAGSTQQATLDFLSLFDQNYFQYTKPVQLLTYLISLSTVNVDQDIILDFFAGSGTTGHAVLESNKQDGGNRKFVLVQLPEPTGTEDFTTIAEITKERVRRVIKKLNDSETGKLPIDAPQDRGFRVFKLAPSNFKSWNAIVPKDRKTLEHQLELHVDHILPSRDRQDILYEILLKSGFPLTAPTETLSLAGKQAFSIADGELLICLESELTLEVIRAIAARKPERVVCLDAGFAGNDQLKANAVQIFKTQGIPSFKTV